MTVSTRVDSVGQQRVYVTYDLEFPKFAGIVIVAKFTILFGASDTFPVHGVFGQQHARCPIWC